jgi:hypothetical protein
MKIRSLYSLFTILFLFNVLPAQNNKPCSTEEGKQFDFWVGQWDASWEGGKGINNISKILGGCVVFEEFDATPSSPLIGKSFSVYNIRTGKWHQTWVDNSGGYLDFSGNWQDDKMILSRSAEIKGVVTIQRMVWYNITDNKFDWNWEKSTDGGKTWTVSWKIQYTRKK